MQYPVTQQPSTYPFDELVPEEAKYPDARVRWSQNFQGAYVLTSGANDSHVTIFADKLSDKQKAFLIENKWASRGELEKLGKPLVYSEFHVTFELSQLHFYYRTDGRRIYKTGKITSEQTAIAKDNWKAADEVASLFLMSILHPYEIYDPQGNLVYVVPPYSPVVSDNNHV